ncbi:hypothetical protein [Micromonospora sp. NPDC048947]|uniref:hypothetical protein n=1 Tax=Micromonospora sp. NPDC048947 TaxID=3154826 RepID=UPI0033E79A6A
MAKKEKTSSTLLVVDPSDTGDWSKAQQRDVRPTTTAGWLLWASAAPDAPRVVETFGTLVTLDGPLTGQDTDALKKSATGADTALVAVPAGVGPYEAACAAWFRSALVCLHDCGVPKVIVACDNMRDSSVNYSQGRFKIMEHENLDYAKRAGYEDGAVSCVPIDHWTGENLYKLSANMSWYKGDALIDIFADLRPR